MWKRSEQAAFEARLRDIETQRMRELESEFAKADAKRQEQLARKQAELVVLEQKNKDVFKQLDFSFILCSDAVAYRALRLGILPRPTVATAADAADEAAAQFDRAFYLQEDEGGGAAGGEGAEAEGGGDAGGVLQTEGSERVREREQRREQQHTKNHVYSYSTVSFGGISHGNLNQQSSMHCAARAADISPSSTAA